MTNSLHNPSFNLQERQHAKKAAEDESRRADIKQHADKLLQGFAKIDDNAPNRAIWELVQNACDLTNQCHVTVDYRNGGFAFSHNGKPFKSKTLISLIKQVSSKGDSNGLEIGRFGTGFITTHAFGRKFRINSLLDLDGQYIRIKDFLIDRTPLDWEGMVAKLAEQEDNVYKIIEKGEMVETPERNTTFSYLPESETERKYIINSYALLHEYIPIVLTINERLLSFTIIAEDGKIRTYTKINKDKKEQIWKTSIKTDTDILEVFSLQNEAQDLEIVLPLRSENEALQFHNSIARLFLYYPLVGTEKWGCNFIIHSKRFKPTEPRDGIHLRSKNEQVQEDEKINRGLIEEASLLIFGFMQKLAINISYPIFLAPIEFEVAGDKPELNEYYKELKKKWVTQFRNYLLVETEKGRITPENTIFLNKELLLEEASIPSTYYLAQKFWANLPKEDLVQEWTRIMNCWDADTSFKYKKAIDLAIKIQEKRELKAIENTTFLQQHYQFLLNYEHGDLFNKYKLLPNIDGNFRLLTALNSKVQLTQELVDISKVIAPEVPAKHIHEDFKFTFELSTYQRSDYSKDITDQITRTVKENTLSQNIPIPFFYKLLEFCLIARSAESTSIPIKMVKLIAAHYGQSADVIDIPMSEGQEIDNRTAQKRLLQVYLNDIARKDSEWVIANLQLIEDTISTMGQLKEYNDLLQTARIFPNKLHELCQQTGLKIDGDILPELKEMYDRICRPKLPLDATLVHTHFEKYLTLKEVRTSKSLGTELEATFSDNGQYQNINQHPYQTDIITIIKHMTSDGAWADYFPHLSGRKANIMLDRASGDLKGAMFKIMNLSTEKANALSQLVEKENFEQILAGLQVSEHMQKLLEKMENLPGEQVEALEKFAESGHLEQIISMGLSAWEEQKRSDSDFAFKHAIGKRIESLIKEKIGQELILYSVDVRDIQNGQDIVIRKELEEIFYIEVKSRWKSSNSIMMSKNQFKHAAANKDKYSLCCVEMSDYKIGEPGRYEIEDINIIFDRITFINTIGHEIEPLVQGIFNSTDTENEITLTGDYKATIPQRLIKTGASLDTFVNYLTTEKL